jgi:hypothetical protein
LGDPAKAEKLLGWKRTVGFEDLVREMVSDHPERSTLKDRFWLTSRPRGIWWRITINPATSLAKLLPWTIQRTLSLATDTGSGRGGAKSDLALYVVQHIIDNQWNGIRYRLTRDRAVLVLSKAP